MNTEDARPLAEVVEKIGFGAAQVPIAFFGAGMWLSDGTELLIISSVATAMAKDWNLSGFVSGLIVTGVFVGIFLGNLSSGPFTVSFGQRRVIIASYVGITVFSILSSFTTSALQMFILRLLVGIFIGIGQPAFLSLNAEMTPSYWRVPTGALLSMNFAIGELYAETLLALDDPSLKELHWQRLLRMAAAPPFLLAMLSVWMLPQSPTWLALNGYYEEAKEVLQSMCRRNGVDSAVDFKIPPFTEDREASTSFSSFLSLTQKQLKVIARGNLFIPTMVLAYTCFVTNLTFYGSLYAFPQVLPKLVHGSTVYQLVCGSFAELPAVIIGIAVGMTFLRKQSLKLNTTLLSISLLLFVIGVKHRSQHFLMNILFYVGYYGIKCFPPANTVITYQMSVETFPGEVRTTGSALCLAGGRIGAMLAPVAYELITEWTDQFLYFFVLLAGLAVLNLYLIDLLIETYGVLLKDYSEDVDEERHVRSDLSAVSAKTK